MGKKVIYPPADPNHLCQCDCHKPENAGVNYFDGCQCCYLCACGNHIEHLFIDDHRRTCKPTKNRHKKSE